MYVRVILKSVCDQGQEPLVTLHARFPRFLLPEWNTHRAFCISGDAVIDFDLPAGSRGARRKHSMTIREFYDKWVNGAAVGKAPAFKDTPLVNLDDTMIYTVHDVAAALDLESCSNLNKACREGTVPGAFKVDRTWAASGSAWKSWRENMGRRRFSIRHRLKKMNIRQLDERTGKVVTSNVKDAMFSGIKRVFRLEAGRYSVSATEDHRILTTDGWKRLGDIQVGVDSVVTYAYGTDDPSDPDRFNKIDGRWVQTWSRRNRHIVAERQNNKCAITGEDLRPSFHLHHIQPRHERPDLAFELDNVQAVNPDAHISLHETQGWQTGVPLISAEALVTSIVDEGETDTYDLEIAGDFANFFADGIVVHNSRNARSSRAVPVKTMIEEVLSDPVIPWHWTKNQPGMQGEPGHDSQVYVDEVGGLYLPPEDAWRVACHNAVDLAQAFADAGYHKQVSNRLLEPFMWIDVLVTADKWDNFFELRDHPDAEPHFQELAQMIRKAIDEAEAQELTAGEWHLPYITEEDRAELPLEDLQKVSVARCARISYTPFDGNASYEREFERFKKLLGPPVHASAFEHVAQADWIDQPYAEWANPEQHRNFTGWNQYRAQFA